MREWWAESSPAVAAYIAAYETECDFSGLLQEVIALRENNMALEALLVEARDHS